MPIVAEDGKRRNMVCLPLRKLAGWLRQGNTDVITPRTPFNSLR
ncbi:hypothetical protein Q1B88_004475 [Salmonella enterica]|nr:hypothetical protein [Salmonella enterica]